MVVDLLHEFELGVWKALLTHLIRILHAASKRPGALVDILNTRYLIVNREEMRSHQLDFVRFLRLADLPYGVFTTMSQR